MSNYGTSGNDRGKEKNGPPACPYNYLYWDVLDRNKEKLGNNPRLGMPYRTLNKMTDEKRQSIQRDGQIFFKALDNNEKVWAAQQNLSRMQSPV